MATTLIETGTVFEREIAFSRTLGIVTRQELAVLERKRVAIAGLGGVGGSHLLTLTRLGIGRFHLAEFDKFGLENFNRQTGANLSTLGRPKLDVMEEAARQINPELHIRRFPEGLTRENIDEFLEGVDIYVDGLDFFVFEMRERVFRACYEKGIPALTAGPLGMGAAVLIFLPGKMSFDQYINWKRTDCDLTKAIKFLVGVAPSLPHRHALVDRSYVNLHARRGPSTPMGCELCAGFAGAEVLKILLKRGNVRAVPHALHFDAYLNRFYSHCIPFGNRNPVQRLKIAVVKRTLGRQRA
ncbi:MAG TPA: ThiF family adenylyltransferase [Terriglobales bacterium]|nr:ThiF family adenylyltransferase [Terriglobales bacterium]